MSKFYCFIWILSTSSDKKVQIKSQFYLPYFWGFFVISEEGLATHTNEKEKG
jgi:hypothetical protein